MSRSPHGERGLKFDRVLSAARGRSRSPHGERGLKSAAGTLQVFEEIVALLMESVD